MARTIDEKHFEEKASAKTSSEEKKRFALGRAEKTGRAAFTIPAQSERAPTIFSDGGRQHLVQGAEIVPKIDSVEPKLNEKESQENGRR